MNMWLLLIGLLIGALLVYVVQKPKLKTFISLDEETAQKNKELQTEYSTLQIELAGLNSRRDEMMGSIEALNAQAKEAGEKMFEQSRQIAAINFEQQAEVMANKFQEYQESVKDEYLHIMEDMSTDASRKLQEYQTALVELEHTIADKKAIASAAVEANKRAAAMLEQQDFYRLKLSPADIAEIDKLKSVLPYLRDSEPLNKVIWKVYYEKPYTDLIGRVVGTGIHTGIYKITNVENQMCYIGQAANIADRWKQHIKRGIGAETPTRNKLYPAMAENGVENFTFEIIEECDRSLLNSREDYWQDYFHAKDFGYSIK